MMDSKDTLEVTETITGWNVSKSCPVCKDGFVWVHNSREKNRAIEAVNMKFNEVHLECTFSINEQ